MIQFLLNGTVRTERHLDPNVTVLEYLRGPAGRPGTKEGCASGDCGACTVVVGELEGERIRYRSLNACLTFVATLHGKQLITVEDLKHQGRLHSVQQAMVDCHASQCGFCTPGFVMSLFALQKDRAALGRAASGRAASGNTTPHEPTSPERNDPTSGGFDREETLEALAGNLCRCTGYRPIIAAAEQACNAPCADQFDAAEADTVARLKAIAPRQTGELGDGEKRCLSPMDLAELATLYAANPQARLLAGGTDLALEVTQAHRALPLLIHVGHVHAMKRIEVDAQWIAIGAAAALSDCYQALSRDYPDFGHLLHRFASRQIRNQGTLGGNIGNASPIGDTPPLLIALGAQVVLNQAGQRRTLALEDFFVDYKVTARRDGEFIERVLVPRARPGQAFRAYKVSKRLDDDISAVCAAFNLEVADGRVRQARVAFGGMAATPRRAMACEAALDGAAWQEDSVERACAALAGDFTPLSDFRASRAYRLRVAQNLLRKCFIELQSPEIQTRVTDHA